MPDQPSGRSARALDEWQVNVLAILDRMDRRLALLREELSPYVVALNTAGNGATDDVVSFTYHGDANESYIELPTLTYRSDA